jgi:aspartyl aminopeptidase
MDSSLDRFLAFLDASPTPHHAVATAAAALETRGLEIARRGGSLFAWRRGRRAPEESGFRLIAAHTDSPNLRIKPQPLVRSHGYVRLGVEVYGGVQVATWVDRDLGIAGVVHVREGEGVASRLVDVRRPVARVPTLAIHLNRSVNEDGLKLNAQTELPAVFAQETEKGADGDGLRRMLAAEIGCAEGDILTWDLALVDLAPATRGGAHGEFVFSGRLDNLGSTHAAVEALLASGDADTTAVIALFDHEEIGSRTSRGADGRALESVLRALCGDLEAALSRSLLVSADMAHAIHPAFADKSESEHAPKMNGGPAIKLNVNQRYSSEGSTTARFVLLCERAEVPYQWYVHRSDMACGSTVGPMVAARLGVPSVDVGNPMLSMHSSREQCGAHDHDRMIRVMTLFLEGA